MNFPRAVACLFAAAFGVAGLSRAASSESATSPRMVVELFTSQGCSSCPPADALLAKLAKEPDVIALSLPVDYWDYLGWKDTLATPAHTKRQKGYSIARGDRQVYTPQAVVDGVAHCVGSNRAEIEKAAKESRGRDSALTVAVSLRRGDDGQWSAQLPAAPAVTGAQVVVMSVTKSREIAIGRGENADRKITYTNIVRGITPLGEWSGAAKAIPIEASAISGEGVDGFVVFVQVFTPQGKPGAILGAAKSEGL
ncbi:DUF1223 domain-containing protein [Terrarubrum flagellatum]|uniref:DUF1223 domain-containing protein n=1 Tax=Terrirubrum flagellatum TaxID=2895980 RepID=UPI003144DF04